MTSSPAVCSSREMKTNNLALAFQEVFTVILRTRFFVQRVENAESFRATLRKMISAAVKDASAMGYSDEASKMAIYAMIGFLDESVLNSKDPTFADWARRPLQEEMFGGHFAGEYFFRNVTDLLNRPESAEVADVLELHALCLLLGYRGRFAFGDASEIHSILHRIRDKITRIRGAYALFRPAETPAAPPPPKRDPWVRRLAFTAILLAVFTLLAYIGYVLHPRPVHAHRSRAEHRQSPTTSGAFTRQPAFRRVPYETHPDWDTDLCSSIWPWSLWGHLPCTLKAQSWCSFA